MSPLLNSIIIWGTGVLIALFLGWIWWLDARTDYPAKRQPSGFEVKLNTGEEPVLTKERENDHG